MPIDEQGIDLVAMSEVIEKLASGASLKVVKRVGRRVFKYRRATPIGLIARAAVYEHENFGWMFYIGDVGHRVVPHLAAGALLGRALAAAQERLVKCVAGEFV